MRKRKQGMVSANISRYLLLRNLVEVNEKFDYVFFMKYQQRKEYIGKFLEKKEVEIKNELQ